MTDPDLTDAQLDALDTFALHVMAPRGRDSVRAYARAAIAADRAQRLPDNCDVRQILLDVVPGEDGMGHEVYAKCVDDVVNVLTEMGQKLEDGAADRAQRVGPAMREGCKYVTEVGKLCRKCGFVHPGTVKTDAESVRRGLMQLARGDSLTYADRVLLGAAIGLIGAGPAADRAQRVGLTESRIYALVSASEVYQYHPGAILEFVRAIEALHGITPPVPTQTPPQEPTDDRR